MANKFNFKPIERKARGAMETALVLIGNEAKNHFVGNFEKQGFDDRTVEKWERRKKFEAKGRGSKKSAKEYGTIRSVRAGRAILVKRGDLRRSIIRGLINKFNLSVKVKTDLDYAKIHNDGLMGRAWGKHPFKMPKRKFIGDSYNLNEKVKKILTAKLDSIFK